MLAFLIKACVAALKKFPEFNSSLDGDALIYKQYFHIGFAADTPNGLVVPVIKDADKKGILQISQEMGELAKKARDGKLTPADMSGACFTISSLGGIGGRYFTPIINAPEVAILGVCKSHHGAGVGRQGLPAAPDAAAVADLGPPRDRRRRGRALQRLPRPDPGRLPPGSVVTTVVVVKKAGQVAIAADTLVTFGDTRLSHRHEANSKLFKVDTPAGPSWVGMAGTVAHFPVLRKAMNALPKDQLLLGSRDEVFDTFVRCIRC
jgi:hypothetical protein